MADETNTVLKHFQIFRNKEIVAYDTYALALAAAKAAWDGTFVTNKELQNGEFVLFNYKLGTASKVESILGIVRDGAIDIIGSYDQLTTEYKAYVDSAIAELNATVSNIALEDGATTNDIKVEVVETDGVITTVKVTDKLAKVAHSGAAADVTFNDSNVADTLTGILKDIVDLESIDPVVTTVVEGTGIKVTDNGTDNDHAYTVQANFTVDTKKYTAEEDADKAGKTYIRIMDGETLISETDAAAFVKDGFLQEVKLIEASEGQENVLRFTWNSDAGVQVTDIKVSELCDVYTADETYLLLNGFKFEHKTSGVTAGEYAANAANVTVNSTTETSFKVPTLTVDAAGHVTAASEKTVTIALPASINTAIQGGAGVNTTYIKTTVARNSTNTNQLDVTSTAVIGDYAAEGQVEGLATTTTTKAYVDGKIATVNTAIEALDVDPFSLTTLNGTTLQGYQISEVDGKIVKGETANTLLTFVSAPTASNKVATQAEIAALDAEVTSVDGTNVQVKVTEVDGVITAVNVVNDVTASKSALDTEIARAKAAEEANTTAIAIEKGRIDAMDLAATDVVALNEGKTALQAGQISETDGKVAVGTAATLVEFNQALSDTNKVATMADITAAAVTGQEAIKVENKVVSLKLATGETVLSQDATGLKSTIALSYDSATTKIKLTGIDGANLGEIDATDFVKDGILQDVVIVEGTGVAEEGQTQVLEDGHRYFKFTYKTVYYDENNETTNTEKVVYLDVESLVDSYTSGNEWIVIDQSANTISHKTVNGLDSTNAHGITESVTVDSTTEKSFKVPTLTVDAAGHVVSVDEKTVTITLPATIDTAVQEVTSDTYVTATKNGTKVTLSTVIGDYAAEGQKDGLATTSATKTYVDTKVGEANTAITNAIAELDATVSNIALEDGATTNDIRVEVVETDGVITAVNVTDKLAKVAHSGAAADVTYTRGSGDNVTNMTVQAAISALEAVVTWDAGTY